MLVYNRIPMRPDATELESGAVQALNKQAGYMVPMRLGCAFIHGKKVVNDALCFGGGAQLSLTGPVASGG
ncbi:hypothetical protein D516_3608 [Rhodobacter sp. AKP1]|nr:hypothetical protein D516_3608 [Rhodobacter sp. AKP1]